MSRNRHLSATLKIIKFDLLKYNTIPPLLTKERRLGGEVLKQKNTSPQPSPERRGRIKNPLSGTFHLVQIHFFHQSVVTGLALALQIF